VVQLDLLKKLLEIQILWFRSRTRY